MNQLTPSLNYLLDSWLSEDLGRGDLTAIALQNRSGNAYWIAKEPGIFCGGLLAKRVFERLDQSVKTQLLVKDGENFSAHQKLLQVKGPAVSLAAGERTSLNLAMRLSGIATATSRLVKELEGTDVKLADTRKTTPGMRVLEKYAFRCGGGINHRLGLDDAAMIKENHIAWAGSVEKAVKAIRSQAPWPSRIIVEAETAKQAKDAVIAGADGILLDEISPNLLIDLIPELRQLLELQNTNGKPRQLFIEASGVDPNNLKAYAATGIDLISTSSPITKSPWLDFSMRFYTSE